MAKRKFSPWFPGGMVPARTGVYQRGLMGVIIYSRWDGNHWLYGALNPAAAVLNFKPSEWQHVAWRGLAQEPK